MITWSQLRIMLTFSHSLVHSNFICQFPFPLKKKASLCVQIHNADRPKPSPINVLNPIHLSFSSNCLQESPFPFTLHIGMITRRGEDMFYILCPLLWPLTSPCSCPRYLSGLKNQHSFLTSDGVRVSSSHPILTFSILEPKFLF